MTNSYAPSRQAASGRCPAGPDGPGPLPLGRGRPGPGQAGVRPDPDDAAGPRQRPDRRGQPPAGTGRAAGHLHRLGAWLLAAVLLLLLSRSTLISLLTHPVASLLLVLGLAGAGHRLGRAVHQHAAADPAGAAGAPDAARRRRRPGPGHGPQQRLAGLRRLPAQRRPRRHRQHLLQRPRHRARRRAGTTS